MTADEAAQLEAKLAETDSRLVAVVYQALRESALVARDFVICGRPDDVAEHVARAVWAWLAEGDE